MVILWLLTGAYKMSRKEKCQTATPNAVQNYLTQ
jgi:hypothetical protein